MEPEELAPEETPVDEQSSDAGEETTLEASEPTEETPSDSVSETSEVDDKPTRKQNRKTAPDRIRQQARQIRDLKQELAQKPDPSDFDDGVNSPEYIQQQINHGIDQELNNRDNRQYTNQLNNYFNASLAQADEIHGKNKVNEAYEFVGTNITDDVANIIKNSERAGELVVHLSENPDVLSTLSNMSPVQAAMKLGQINAEIGKPSAKTVTSAPAPVTTVGSNQTTEKELNEDMTQSEYEAAARKKRGGSVHVS